MPIRMVNNKVFPSNVACFVWNSVRIGQNLLNEVSVESSIPAYSANRPCRGFERHLDE